MHSPATYPYFIYGEDHLIDQALLVQLMSNIDPSIKVLCVSNGLEIIQYLDGLPNGASYPGCILLDLDMPMWDGFRTLRVLKEHPKYHPIPCIVFSNSTSIRDQELANKSGAEEFLLKSASPEKWLEYGELVASFCKRPAMNK